MLTATDIPLRIGNDEKKLSSALTKSDYAKLPGTEFMMNHTFWVGVAQNNTPQDMKRTSAVIHEFVQKYGCLKQSAN